MTFPVSTPEEDAVVMLFDVLYEKLTVFTKQYWLGELHGVWHLILYSPSNTG
jgi:hypothetical protein